jgi:hypothetical protein
MGAWKEMMMYELWKSFVRFYIYPMIWNLHSALEKDFRGKSRFYMPT